MSSVLSNVVSMKGKIFYNSFYITKNSFSLVRCFKSAYEENIMNIDYGRSN